MSALLPALSHAIERMRSVVDVLSRAAMLAPSAENVHRLRPRWDGAERLDLVLDHAWDHLTGQQRILGLLGAGAMAENLAQAAAAAGYAADRVWHHAAGGGQALVELRLRSDPTADGHLAAAIPQRCTNRRPYADEALDRSLIGRLQAAAGPVVRTDWFTTAPARQAVAGLAATAETARARSHHLHEEVVPLIRWEAGWSGGSPRGLPPGSLEIPRLLRPFSRISSSWSFLRLAGPLGMAALQGHVIGRAPVRASAAVVAISCGLPLAEAASTVGEAMQRLWLEATLAGLAVHPVPTAALFALPQWAGVDEGARVALQEGWARLTPGRQPLMLLRLGRAEAPSVRAGRPVSWD